MKAVKSFSWHLSQKSRYLLRICTWPCLSHPSPLPDERHQAGHSEHTLCVLKGLLRILFPLLGTGTSSPTWSKPSHFTMASCRSVSPLPAPCPVPQRPSLSTLGVVSPQHLCFTFLALTRSLVCILWVALPLLLGLRLPRAGVYFSPLLLGPIPRSRVIADTQYIFIQGSSELEKISFGNAENREECTRG